MIRELLSVQRITHYHTYPKTPKMNAYCEIFNGTFQAEFVDFHVSDLFNDISTSNTTLHKYLQFYNIREVQSTFQAKLTSLYSVYFRLQCYKKRYSPKITVTQP